MGSFVLEKAIPVMLGVAVAMGELYMTDRTIPFAGDGPGRLKSWTPLIGAFCFGALLYAGPIAEWIFQAEGPQQYFMASLAAIEAISGRKLPRRNSRGPQASAVGRTAPRTEASE